jgi:CHAT domain-containing protein
MLMKKLVLCVFLFSGWMPVYAQKWEKSLEKIDAAYYTGDYEKAKKGLDKFSKKVTKKLGKENQYTAPVFIREAHLTLALGQLQGFDGFLQNAEASTRVMYGENSANYISILIQIAEAWNLYGYSTKAKIHLDKALEVYKSMRMEDELLLAQVDIILAETLIHMGFNNEALSLINKHENFFIGRAVDRESTVDESGRLKTVKLSEEEIKARYHAYAKFLTLRADAYANKGHRDSTTYAYDYAASYMLRNRKYLGEQSTPYIQNQLNYINYFMDNGARYNDLPKDLKYETVLNYLKAQHKTTHYLAFPLYEGIMKQLLLDGSRAKFANVKAEYEKNIKSTFKKSSLYSVNLRTIEFQTKVAKERTRSLENEAATIIIQQAVPRFHPKTVEILDFLIDLSIRENRFLNAEGYISDVMSIKEEVYGINSPEYHLSKIKLANFYLDFTNKIEEAGIIYNNSYYKIVEPQIHPFHKDHLEILNHLAAYYDDLDRYDDAQIALKKLSEISRTKFDNKDPEYAIALEKIAGFRIDLGDYETATEELATASSILNVRRLSDEYVPAQVKTMETQARLNAIQGYFDEAESLLASSRKISSKASTMAMANDFNTREQLSNILIYLGRYTEPEKMLNSLITEYETIFGRESRRLIVPLLDQGRLYLLKGDYTKAEQQALRANKIAVKLYGENSTKTAPTQKLLADIYYSFGDYENSRSNLVKALRTQEARYGRNHIEVAKSLSQLALNMFYDGEDKGEIEKMMVEARDIIASKVGFSTPQYADIMKNLAVLYISEKKYEQAFSALTTAENIWVLKAGRKNNINTASIYVLTGDVYYQLRNFKKSDEFYNKAKSLYEKNFSKQHPEYVKVLSKLSRVYYMEGDSKNARKFIEEALANYEGFIKLYFPALSEREKAKYWNTIKADFEFYNTIAFSQPDSKDLMGKVYDYQLLTKAILLSSSIKIRERIMSSTDEALKEKYSLWIEKKEFLTAALSMSTAQLAEDGINPSALQIEIEKIEKELSQQSELFGQDFENKKISWTDVRKSLNPNEVAIEMVRFRHFNHSFTDSVVYAALYVKNEKASPTPSVILLKNGKMMEARNYIFYRNAMMREYPDSFSYDVFWKPIQDHIGLVSTIYLSADGVYNLINLESIPTPDGRYILDNSNIVLVSNTKDIYVNKIKTRPNSKNNLAMMFGDPQFYLAEASDKVLPLPGTEKEVIELNKLLNSNGWRTEYYLKDQATEELVKEIQSPKIFHIATHGMYVPVKEFTLEDEIAGNESLAGQNPLLRNGLLLKGAGDILERTEHNFNMENGILTAYEAMSLNLDQTDLVVLSACETGLGDIEQGEGVYGLQRAFLVAGAKTLIMSLFKVADTPTQELMIKFYRNWLSTGNQRQSFIDAKKELRLEYPEPIYWGAFIMIGME